MIRRYRTGAIVCAALAIATLLAMGSVSQAADLPTFPKDDGSFYMGGTKGLHGLDSVRGYVDSCYFAKWWDAGVVPPIYYPSSDKVVYGNDDRVDIYNVTDPNLLHLAQACCVVVSTSEISNNGDGTYTLDLVPWLNQSGSPICNDEPFKGQPQIGNCSGFLVGDTIIVTAGHCLSASSCGSWAFLFGYVMVDSATWPSAVVPEDNIYFCSHIINQALAGDLDYCVFATDRKVVGRQPIPIRREGIVPNGDSVVVVGHPAVLPMKVGGGAIVQNNNGSIPWFQTNTDTYGGNSGSMIVNTSTWQIEGILVRGAPDYVNDGGCTRSNVVPNSGNTGSGLQFEEVSKSTSFAQYVPELVNSTGVMFLGSDFVSCSDSLSIELRDIDLAGNVTHQVTVTSSSGDSESVTVTENADSSGIFMGAVADADEAVVLNDGVLQVSAGDSIGVTYNDADDGSGSPATVLETASVDCTAPVISGVTVDTVNGVSATITFMTDELATAAVHVGTSCGSYTLNSTGGQVLSHTITVGGLTPLTDYHFDVEATDIAGNSSSDDNGGGCYLFSTPDQADYFTQQFGTSTSDDMQGGTITFTPDSSIDYYDACRDTTSAFPTDPAGGTVLALGDDSTLQVSITGGEMVSLYGQTYSSVYVCSNGFIGLGFNGHAYQEDLADHFAATRIDAYWDDFDPRSQGTISYKQLSDRLVVTWENIPEFNTTNSNNFQVEMFFDGKITITHLAMGSLDGLVGLSQGGGEPTDFIESDMSAYPGCQEVVPSCCVGMTGNVDGDANDEVTLSDLSVMIDHLFISLAPLSCPEEANTDGMGDPNSITLGDLSALIDHLFISLLPLPACP